jgi:alkaline phosphatase
MVLMGDSCQRDGLVLSFGAFTDAHYAHKVYGSRHCQDSLIKLRACIDTFNDRDLPLIVNLGDSLDGGESKVVERGYLAALREAWSRFEGEVHVLLGNHDLATLTKREFIEGAGLPGGGDEESGWYDSFDCGDVHLIVLDSNYHQDGTPFGAGDFQWDNAWISEAQIAWLADDLQAAQGRSMIVFCHGNLDDRRQDERTDPHVVRNAGVVRSVLERAGNVRAVLQAHYHPGMRTTIHGIPYVGLAAMVEGPGLENNAYAIVSLYENGDLCVEGFGRQDSYCLAP